MCLLGHIPSLLSSMWTGKWFNILFIHILSHFCHWARPLCVHLICLSTFSTSILLFPNTIVCSVCMFVCERGMHCIFNMCRHTHACILVYPGWSFHSGLPYNGCMIAQNSSQMLKENTCPLSQKCTSAINQWPCQPSGPRTTSFSFLFFNGTTSRFFPGTDRSDWLTLSELSWSQLVGRSARFQRY